MVMGDTFRYPKLRVMVPTLAAIYEAESLGVEIPPQRVKDVARECYKMAATQKKVNEITGLSLKKGRVGFATSNADYTIRKIELETFRH